MPHLIAGTDDMCRESRPCVHERSETVVHDAAGACEPGYHRGRVEFGTTCRCGALPFTIETLAR